MVKEIRTRRWNWLPIFKVTTYVPVVDGMLPGSLVPSFSNRQCAEMWAEQHLHLNSLNRILGKLKAPEGALPLDIVAKATSAMRKVRVLDAKGEPLSAAMMREVSLWIESDKWKVVMSPYTSAAYEAAAEVVKVSFYRPTFQGDAAACESPESHRDTKFASIREDLFFPRDQVWLVDENFYIAGKIVNLRTD